MSSTTTEVTAGMVVHPGAGRFWLTSAQLRAASELLNAYRAGGNHDVPAEHLLAAAGGDAASVDELFAGSGALGALVLPGARQGTYRLADPGGDDAG